MSVLEQLGIDTKTAKNQSQNLMKMIQIQQMANINTNENMDTERLIVFTDGACSQNGSKFAKAGYAVVWPYRSELNIKKRLIGFEQTNNRAEYSALIEAQKIADQIDRTQQKPLYVYTDSQLLIDSITKWLSGWKKNGWKKADKKPVLNQDLLKQIDDNPRPLIFKHVRAHTGRKDWESINNDLVDRLAREAINDY